MIGATRYAGFIEASKASGGTPSASAKVGDMNPSRCSPSVMSTPATAPPSDPVNRSSMAFNEAPTLACMTIIDVSTAHWLCSRCSQYPTA